MAAESYSAVSTYNGQGFSFAKSVASKVLEAAKAAREVKHKHDAMERRGQKVPEAEKKGVFARALKEQFVVNPVKGLKKSLGAKVTKGAAIVGLFGKKGRATERKILAANKKYLNARKKRSGSGGATTTSSTSQSSGSTTGGLPVSFLGSIVLDIEQIASSISSMTGLLNTNLGLTYKISGGLAEIKNILTEQLSLQKGAIDDEIMRSKEAALENSQQNSGSVAATSTMTGGGMFDGLLDLLNIPRVLQQLTGFISRIPAMIKGIVSKLPGGQFLIKGASKAASSVGGAVTGLFKGATGFMKGGLMKFLRPVFKRIPIFGGLLDFAVSLALGEPVGRAAAKSVGAMLGAGLGSLIPVPGVGTIAGGVLGDWVGGTLYDAIAGPKAGEQKLSEGGVMVGEAGPEMITSLDSVMGKKALTSGPLEEAYNQPYNAVAGGMLAVTKDFVEGLGPIGSSVAPVIQDDVDKLGRIFDIPSTSTNIEVGGASLKANPLAEKEGKKYMEDLIKGSLEKIAPKKEETKTASMTGSSSPSTTPTTETPAPAAPSAAPSAAPAPKLSSGEQTLKSLQENTKFVNKQQTGMFGQQQVISAVSGTDKAGVRRVKMVDEDGKLSDRYYYNANGDIFSVDPTLGTKGISQLSPDMIKSGLGNRGKFYRNLQTGQVVVTNRPPVGYYNYEKHGIVQESLAQAQSNAVNMELRTVKTKPIGSLTDVERQNFGSQPYGPVADISKIKAEKGIVVTSRKGNRYHPVTGQYKPHNGTDISAPQGTKLFAFSNGRIEDVRREGKNDAGYGNSVYWVDDRGWGHLYAHLHKFGTGIAPGAEIKKGKLLGSVGSTGISTGPHLHWEMAQNPADVGRGGRTLIDPLSKYDYMSPFRGTPGPGDGLTGDVPGDNTTGEYSDREEVPEDPFERMRKAIEAMGVGLGLMSGLSSGKITSKEEYDQFKSTIQSKVSSSAAVNPTDKATTPDHFRKGGGSAGAAPAPVQRAASPTPASSDTLSEQSRGAAAPTMAVLPLSGPTQQVVPTTASQQQGMVNLAGPSRPSAESTAVAFAPYTQLTHLWG